MGGEKIVIKIGIMTLYYKNYNYGGQLQAYALCKYLNSFSEIQCEQIAFDYKRDIKKKKTLKSFGFEVYSRLVHPLVRSGLKKRKHRFKKFQMQVPHSDVVDEGSILEYARQYDYVVVGSDQVWNNDYAGRLFFLGFLDKKKRCAYAASFGKNKLDEYQNQDIISILKDYQFLTVREDTAKVFIEENGISNVNVVCDPTLLLSREQWECSIADIVNPIRGDYIFVYLLGSSQEIREKIKRKARECGLQIVYIPHIHFSYQKRDRNFADVEMYDVGPWEFVRLIRDAKVVVTDSFHCTLFSIMFEKNFWTLQKERDDKNATSSRMVTLLSKVSLTDHFVNSVEKIDLQKKISYSDLKSRMDSYIKQSQNLIEEFFIKKRH